MSLGYFSQSCRVIIDNCRELENVSDSGIECNETSSNCSTVDEVSSDILQVNTCRLQQV